MIASSPDFDAVVDAFHRQLAACERAGPEVIKIYRLQTELEGALTVYPNSVHVYWVGRCDHSVPAICLERQPGWYRGVQGGPFPLAEQP